jgi:hypothetical protein
MSEVKTDEKESHTPGPWSYFPAQNYEGFAIAPLGRLPTLAAIESKGCITAFNYPGQTEPNARLIAAAPELLAICEDLLNIPELVCECGRPECRTTQLRAVLAKVRGRS